MSPVPEMLPESKELLENQRRTWAGITSIEEKRRAWSVYARSLWQPPPSSLVIADSSVASPDYVVPVRIYRHRGVEEARPCILYMHGGGFMMGDLDSSDAIAWGFAHETGAVVVSVDYRLTPEHPYPAAFNDSWAVLAHVHANPAIYGIDATRIAIAGDSAGGKLTAALCLKARDLGSPRIAAQAIIYANGGTVQGTQSMTLFAEGYGLTAANTAKYLQMLLPDNRYDNDPYAWPVRADDHSGLPPTLVHMAELDVGRDSARHYAAKLVMAGVETTYREGKGLVHGFMRHRFFKPGAKKEYARICNFLKRQLFG